MEESLFPPADVGLGKVSEHLFVKKSVILVTCSQIRFLCASSLKSVGFAVTSFASA